MIKRLICKYEYMDDDEDSLRFEKLWDGDKSIFGASNLTECPEDASLERDIPNADDAIELIKYGMRLGCLGYTDLEVVHEREEY